MAIIISDIHGDINKAKTFLEYRPDVEHVILGDLMDSNRSGSTLHNELECLELILQSDATLIWGNHDLAYTDKPCWEPYSRFPDALQPISLLLIPQIHRFKAAHVADGWLCTHAGISTALIDNLPDLPMNTCDPEIIAEWINNEFQHQWSIPKKRKIGQHHQYYGVGPLFAIDWTRGGNEQYGGIFWYDNTHELATVDPRVKQLFGHTPVAEPLKQERWNNINIEDHQLLYGFDTDIDDFVVLNQQHQ